jgi:hypothetical protein
MRVICIEHLNTSDQKSQNIPNPEIGDIDVVIKSVRKYGTVYYALERFGYDNGYLASCFAILSDLDETTLVNHKPEPACQ